MAKTIHHDKYTIVNHPTEIDTEDWDRIFKRENKNVEKNRYKRSSKKAK